jgi:hypothetical protein
MQKLLAKLFPPEIEHLHPTEELPDTLGYHYRLNRRGTDPHPHQIVGVRVVTIREGQPAPITMRGRVAA